MVIRNRCSSVVEGSPSKCNLCRTSDRQRRVCPRIGQASASRPIVGPTSRPLKIKSDRVRKKKKGEWSFFRFRIPSNSKHREKHRNKTERASRSCFFEHTQIFRCSSLLLKRYSAKKRKEKKKRIAKKNNKNRRWKRRRGQWSKDGMTIIETLVYIFMCR